MANRLDIAVGAVGAIATAIVLYYFLGRPKTPEKLTPPSFTTTAPAPELPSPSNSIPKARPFGPEANRKTSPSPTIAAYSPSDRESKFEPQPPSHSLIAEVGIPSESDEMGVHGKISVGHLLGFRDDVNAYTQLGLQASYRFHPRHTVGALQEARKLYEIASIGESEFPLDDTLIYHEWLFAKQWLTLDWKLRSGFTLPVSKESQDAKHISRPNVRLTVSRKFLNDRLTVSYGPTVSYYWNQYTTTISGEPLKKWTLGHQGEIAYEILPEKLSASLTAKGLYSFNETNIYAKSSPPAAGDYEFGATLSYQLLKEVSVQTGYLHGDSFIKEGRYEVLFYDPAQSRYFFGVEVAL